MTKDQLIDALQNAGGPEVVLDEAIAAITGHARPYTGSVDAALTLVPHGWSWKCAGTNVEHEMTWAAQVNFEQWVDAASAPLALCIAALKAMK